jgi:hypothetical protein
MDANERQMITGLFDRMRAQGGIDKDRDAELLINQAVRQVPDSAYMLVQSVLVQEHTLQQAGQRIEELEARVRELETLARPQAAAQSSGGFLGGLFGGSKPAPQPVASGRQSSGFGSSVPRAGGSPWGQQAAAPMQPHAAPAAGGGFMKSAMATAAGVAGGMLLADSIRGMMSGNSGASPGAQAASAGNSEYGPTAGEANTAADDGSNYGYGGDTEPVADDGGGWGGDDIDI